MRKNLVLSKHSMGTLILQRDFVLLYTLSLWPVRAKNMPSELGIRAKKCDTPTSGKSPICVSGMANNVVSVATRYFPWIDNPTPPPITIPCIKATYGICKEIRSQIYHRYLNKWASQNVGHVAHRFGERKQNTVSTLTTTSYQLWWED